MKRKSGNSFVVEIKSSESSTWQGVVTWVEEQKRQSFRSALELIKLMDSAMSDGEQEPEFEDNCEVQERKSII